MANVKLAVKIDQQHYVSTIEILLKKNSILMEGVLQTEDGNSLKKKSINVTFFAITVITFYIMVVVGESFYKRWFSSLEKALPS